MKNKKRGRPPGAKNKKVSWKQVTDRDEEDNRVKTRQKVVAENTCTIRIVMARGRTKRRRGGSNTK